MRLVERPAFLLNPPFLLGDGQVDPADAGVHLDLQRHRGYAVGSVGVDVPHLRQTWGVNKGGAGIHLDPDANILGEPHADIGRAAINGDI